MTKECGYNPDRLTIDLKAKCKKRKSKKLRVRKNLKEYVSMK